MRRTHGVRASVVGACCAALLAASAGAASAQDDPGSARLASQERLQRLFAELPPLQGVRIVTPDLFIEDAAFQSVSGSVVRVEQEGRTVPVALDEIRAVSVRSGHALQGTLWGTGSGILVGTVSGMMIAGFTCTSPQTCSNDERRGAVRGGILLGITGAVAGWFFGRRDRYWRPIFP